MDSVSLLYWITRLNAINGVVLAFSIVSMLGGLISVCNYLNDVFREGEHYDRIKKTEKKCTIIFFTIGFALLTMFAFIPTTKQAFIIYGVGNTIEYLKSNDKATGLPDKAILALDKYLDECIEDKDTTQTK